MHHPAAIPAIGLYAGICAGIFFLPAVSASILLGILACAVLSFLSGRDRIATSIVCVGFVAAGTTLGNDADSASRHQRLRADFDRFSAPAQHQVFLEVEGHLRSDAVMGPSGVTLDVLIDRVELDGAVRATSGGALISVGGQPDSDRILQWRAGRRVALPATLRVPTNYLDPGAGDTERQSAWRGVVLVGSVKSDRLVDVIAHATVSAEMLASTRAAVRRAVASTVGPWSARSAAVVSAILIGDRAGLDDGVERRLQEAGTYHVIAISGGNIAILAGLSIFVLRFCRFRPRTTAFAVVCLLTIYALIVEGGSSVGRATLMAVIYLTVQLFDHRTPPINVAALTGACLFCAYPLQAVDAGFVLTFGATLGILSGIPKVAGLFPVSPWVRAPVMLFVASLCAEIALLPVGAFVFSRVTFAGLIVNFVAIPLMTIAQVAGMAAAALSPLLTQPARWTGWVAHLADEGLIVSASLVDVFPWLTRRVAPPPLWLMAVYYASLLTIAGGHAIPAIRRTAALGAASAILLASSFCIVESPTFAWGPQPLRVTFLDVGQGDAAIVQFPDGRTLSIDAGGASTSFDIGGRVISPALWALGVRRLDYMSVTHGDNDHIGGAESVFRDFTPTELWEGVPVPPHRPTRALRMLADNAGTPWRTLQAADRVSFGNVELIVHHPPRSEWERQRVRNDDSEVIEILYGGVSFVFTGDISREVERAIGPGFDRAPIRILKVPHHGSATSSSQDFLDALRPDVAVISAGRGNPFGHPVASVLERYRGIGAAIYRTDQDGAVTVETDGTSLTVTGFTGRRLRLTTRGR